MPHALTEVPQIAATAFALPNNAESDGIESIEPTFQALLDRSGAVRDALVSSLAWTETLSVNPGGSAATFTVNVGAIARGVFLRAAVYRVLAAAAATVGASKIEGGGSLSVSSKYYLYVYDNAGTLDYELSTTAPAASLATKTGDASRLYLGVIVTDGAGAPLPMQAHRGRYLYDVGGLSGTELQAVAAGAGGVAIAATDVSVAAWVPAWARLVDLEVSLVNPGGGGGVLSGAQVARGGSAGSGAHSLYSGSGAAAASVHRVSVPLNSSRQIRYATTGGVGAEPSVAIRIIGYSA